MYPAFYKNIKVKGQDYTLKLVDTAGQDEYSIFPPTYAMDIHGYCLVYRWIWILISNFVFSNFLYNIIILHIYTYSINNLKSFDVVRIIYDKLLDMTGKIQ